MRTEIILSSNGSPHAFETLCAPVRRGGRLREGAASCAEAIGFLAMFRRTGSWLGEKQLTSCCSG